MTYGELIKKVSILDIVRERVELEKNGNEFSGICPLCSQSIIYVSPQKRIFYCFGCAAGGDVVKFLEHFHKMPTGKVVRYLADRYGFPYKIGA